MSADIKRRLLTAAFSFLIFLLVLTCLALFKQGTTYMDYKIWKAVALCALAAIYGFWKGINSR